MVKGRGKYGRIIEMARLNNVDAQLEVSAE